MKRILHYIWPMMIFIACVQLEGVQETEFSGGIRYVYGNGMITFSVDNSLDDISVDSLLAIHDLSLLESDSLLRYSDEKVSRSGWTLTAFDEVQISYSKALDEFSGSTDFQVTDIIIGERINSVDDHLLDAVYGANRFTSGQDAGERIDGKVTLTYPSDGSEKEVYIAGTFNNWSTYSQKLEFRNDRWEISLDLPPGKHLYKFIVDGRWHLDPRNLGVEGDDRGLLNNVLFVYNYTFDIHGFFNAERITVQGSFNDWREDELYMQAGNTRWVLPLYLREGTHAYKLKVDGAWQLDPGNPVVRKDDMGYENSFLSIGDTLFFRLKGFEEVREVVVTGDFNAWQENELQMQRTEEGWELPYVLAPGMYEYKYIIDGHWMPDPGNPHSIGEEDYRNSIKVVAPNKEFVLKGHEDADEVFLSGDFNGWSEVGYRMKRRGADWVMSLYLPRGKTNYKYIVDGKWTHDPMNPLWEKNEFDTKNSILWIQ